jgi:hypothetical protein
MSVFLMGVCLIRHASQKMFLAQFSGAKSSAKGVTAPWGAMPKGTHTPFATGLTL